ncbi:hypothetical protein V8E51_013995 [Hyaloscypha variabilis]
MNVTSKQPAFGVSLGDIIIIAAFAKSLHRSCRDAGGDYDDIGDEVRGLHTVLKHLKYEVESWLPDRDHELWGRQLGPIIRDCDLTLIQLDSLLQKHAWLPRGEINSSNPRASRNRDRSGPNEVDALVTIRMKLIHHQINLTETLDTIQLNESRETGTTLDKADVKLDTILDSVDAIAARMYQDPENILATHEYSDDGQAWKRVRKELIAEGFSTDVLVKHKDVLRAYLRQIYEQGLLHAIPPQLHQQLETNTEHVLDSVYYPIPPPSKDVSGTFRSLNTPADKSSAKDVTGITLQTTRTVPELLKSNEKNKEALQRYNTDESSDEDPTSDYLLNRSRLAQITKTSELFSSLPLRSGAKLMSRKPKKSSERLDTNRRMESIHRLAPDEHGNDIPDDAKWTKISRRIVSPEILDQDHRRYEARPEWVAVLGVLSRAEIESYATRSAAVRKARRLRSKTALSKEVSLTSPHLSVHTVSKNDKGYDTSSSTDSDTSDSTDIGSSSSMDTSLSSMSQLASSAPDLPSGGMWVPASRGEQSGVYYPPREGAEERKTQRLQRVSRWKENFPAGSIGGAAVSLLDVLSEAAEGL